MSNENDHLLEHNYDGIQEYDNPLPSWWVWIFWGTILFSPAYFVFYHVGIGPSIHDEYSVAAAEAFDLQAKQFAEMDITEEVLADLAKDSVVMGGMQQRFVAKCATCHGASGAGLACPNLTDGHFKHGATFMDYFTVISEGVSGTEMKAWKDELGPAGVVGLAAYVGTLSWTFAPDGRAPEGAEVAKPTP